MKKTTPGSDAGGFCFDEVNGFQRLENSVDIFLNYALFIALAQISAAGSFRVLSHNKSFLSAGISTMTIASSIVTPPPINKFSFKTSKSAVKSIGTIRRDSIEGSAYNDTLDGGDNNDTLYGFDGNDVIMGGAGDDVLYGGLGNDSLFGGDGNDSVFGEGGNDILSAGIGREFMSGGTGNDILNVAGSGSYFGNEDNDRLVIYDSTAVMGRKGSLSGGSGTDTLDLSNTGKAIKNPLYTLFNWGQYLDSNMVTGPDDRYCFDHSGFERFILSMYDDFALCENQTGLFFDGGNGSDNFSIRNSKAVTINGGAGNDVYRFEDRLSDVTIKAVSGNDTIILDQNGTNTRQFVASFNNTNLVITTTEGTKTSTITVVNGADAFKAGNLSILEAQNAGTDDESLSSIKVGAISSKNTIFWNAQTMVGNDSGNIFHTVDLAGGYYLKTNIFLGAGADKVYLDTPQERVTIKNFDAQKDYLMVCKHEFGITPQQFLEAIGSANWRPGQTNTVVSLPTPDAGSIIDFQNTTKLDLMRAYQGGRLVLSDSY